MGMHKYRYHRTDAQTHTHVCFIRLCARASMYWLAFHQPGEIASARVKKPSASA